MFQFPSRILLSAAAICVIASAAAAQQPVFVEVAAIPLSLSTAKAARGEPGPGEAAIRPSPIVMETSGRIEADGSVSTTCAAEATSTPHALHASRPTIQDKAR